MSYEKKGIESFLLPIIGVASIPLFLYFLRVYGKIISESSVYIKDLCPLASSIILLCLILFGMFFVVIIGYAKAEGYLGINVIRIYKYGGKISRVYACCLIAILLIMLIYNIFCIYIYVMHIGVSPFLTWEEFLDFRK